MRIQTFSIVGGSEACNARCPFCVSKMTVPHGLGMREPEVNWRNFRKACRLAQQCGVTTAMITGKGEPTLFPDQLSRFLRELDTFGFPLVELQTNGIAFETHPEKYEPYLRQWYDLGLGLLALSIVHFEGARNREVYTPDREEYIDLARLLDRLHHRGYSVRLACVMVGGHIDSEESVRGLIEFGRAHGVEQITFRPVGRPEESRSEEAFAWAQQHGLGEEQVGPVREYLEREGTPLMRLLHGAVVYDVDGQNVCLTDCLTIDPGGDDLRQLIFFPDGHLRYDWQYAGAILL